MSKQKTDNQDQDHKNGKKNADQVMDEIRAKVDEMQQQEEVGKQEEPFSELEGLKNELDEIKQHWARAVADYNNLEKRMQKEKEEWIKFGSLKVLASFLDVLDNLDRAAQYIKDPGLDMVRDQGLKMLAEHQVEEIEALGKTFDPETMECVDKQAGEENMVIAVQQKGYQLYGRVLRHAKVVVGISK